MVVTKIGIEFKDMNERPTIQNIIADIVLIDRSSSSTNPVLYILKETQSFSIEDLQTLKDGFSHEDPFIQIGDILTIDKKNKFIILTNQNTVTYKHMIVAAGPKITLLNHEFLAGLQTLIDGLRIREKLPSSFDQNFALLKDPSGIARGTYDTSQVHPQKVERVCSTKIRQPKSSNRDLSSSGNRLYEVQL